MDRLVELLRDFNAVTGQRLGVYDADANIIIEYPKRHNALCALIRESEEGRRRCRQCDLYGVRESANTGKYVVYRCHAGLLEVCMPIKDDRGIAGYIGFGQVLYSDKLDEQLKTVAKNCADIIDDPVEMQSIFPEIRLIDSGYIGSLIHILEACVGYMRLEQMMYSSPGELWDKLNSFIKEHYTEPLSLDELAANFSVSVATLCRCAKQNAGESVGELITSERMKAAARLLTGSDLSISDIASGTGYQDKNYFSRVFRRQLGMTAKEYRSARQGQTSTGKNTDNILISDAGSGLSTNIKRK